MLALVLALACSDYRLFAGKEATSADDTDVDSDVTGTDTAATDTDTDCAVDLAPAGDVAVDPDALGPEPVDVPDPWSLDVAWTYTSDGRGVTVMPAVGRLGDDVAVVFPTWESDTLVALRPDGTVRFELPGYDGRAGVAIADVNGDGRPEVIAATVDHAIAAVDGDGVVEWTSEPIPGLAMYPQPTVADLDGDGSAEVIFDVAVLDGATGDVRAILGDVASSWRTPVVADLDRDGQDEIVLGEDVYDADGDVLWRGRAGTSAFAAVADVDGDPDGEVLMVSAGELDVYDADGTPLSATALPSAYGGPPAVADFDGDGEPEIAIPSSPSIGVYELDGALDWQAPIDDGSGLAGCSGFDADDDGAFELFYADEQDLRIYDGRTGDVLFDDPHHNSGTVWEYPVIADADGDGSADVLFASNFGVWDDQQTKGVTMLSHVGRAWPPAGPAWPVHDYAGSNAPADGSVPAGAHPWLDGGVFRARPAQDERAWPNLTVAVDDVCVARCEPHGVVRIAFHASNDGAVDVAAGVPVMLYAADGSPLAMQALPALPAGRAAAGQEIVTDVASVGAGFTIRVDDDDRGRSAVDELHEDDDAVSAGPVCP